MIPLNSFASIKVTSNRYQSDWLRARGDSFGLFIHLVDNSYLLCFATIGPYIFLSLSNGLQTQIQNQHCRVSCEWPYAFLIQLRLDAAFIGLPNKEHTLVYIPDPITQHHNDIHHNERNQKTFIAIQLDYQ